MKFLKKLILIIAILIAIPLITALFVKRDYSVERSILINKPNKEVFNYIKQLKNRRHYSTWALMDPKMQTAYKGVDGKVGFLYYWKSSYNNVGQGHREIAKIADGQRIDIHIQYIKPFETEDEAYVLTEAVDSNTTRVKWGFKGNFPYPFNLLTLFIDMPAGIGKNLDQSLLNLKTIIEK